MIHLMPGIVKKIKHLSLLIISMYKTNNKVNYTLEQEYYKKGRKESLDIPICHRWNKFTEYKRASHLKTRHDCAY